MGGALSLWPLRRGWSLLSNGGLDTTADEAWLRWLSCLAFVYLGRDKNLGLLDSTQRLYTLGFLVAVDFLAVKEVT